VPGRWQPKPRRIPCGRRVIVLARLARIFLILRVITEQHKIKRAARLVVLRSLPSQRPGREGRHRPGAWPPMPWRAPHAGLTEQAPLPARRLRLGSDVHHRYGRLCAGTVLLRFDPLTGGGWDSDRIIAMSFPSSGSTSAYRNPIEEVRWIGPVTLPCRCRARFENTPGWEQRRGLTAVCWWVGEPFLQHQVPEPLLDCEQLF
jgi:hypothetical protein